MVVSYETEKCEDLKKGEDLKVFISFFVELLGFKWNFHKSEKKKLFSLFLNFVTRIWEYILCLKLINF